MRLVRSTRRELLAGCLGAALGCSGHRAAGSPGVKVEDPPHRPSGLVAVVRPSAYPTLREAVRAVIASAGGLGFVREGQRVLLKPAANSARPYPATFDPEVTLEVAKLVLAAGGRPFIADRTMFRGDTKETFEKLGMTEAAQQSGIECLALDDAPVVRLLHEGATHWGGAVPVYRPVAEADHVIDLCTPRTHRVGDFTMALKNWVGVVDGGARLGMHFPSGFKQRLAEISLVVRPSLVLMDGRQGFTDGGPDSGDLARLDFLAAGADPVAIDAVGLANLRLAGTNARLSSGSIWSLPVMKRAADLRLGATSAQDVHLVGLPDREAARWRRELA